MAGSVRGWRRVQMRATRTEWCREKTNMMAGESRALKTMRDPIRELARKASTRAAENNAAIAAPSTLVVCADTPIRRNSTHKGGN